MGIGSTRWINVLGSANDRFRRACEFAKWTALFGLSYAQAPLYYSNQNQYFLHGLANAGVGCLEEDWLANTADPTPLFSAIISLTYRMAPDVVFYLYYLMMQGLYCWSLLGLFEVVANGRATKTARLCFGTLLVVVHAMLVRQASQELQGVDYIWFLQAGVANQYVLGFGLQPSVAGVFLIASISASAL